MRGYLTLVIYTWRRVASARLTAVSRRLSAKTQSRYARAALAPLAHPQPASGSSHTSWVGRLFVQGVGYSQEALRHFNFRGPPTPSSRHGGGSSRRGFARAFGLEIGLRSDASLLASGPRMNERSRAKTSWSRSWSLVSWVLAQAVPLLGPWRRHVLVLVSRTGVAGTGSFD